MVLGCRRPDPAPEASKDHGRAEQSNREEKELAATEAAVVQKGLAGLADKHQAAVGWQQSVSPRGTSGRPYTADLQDVLVGGAPKQIAFMAALGDVAKVGDRYLATFYFFHIRAIPSRGDPDEEFEFGIVFRLRCDGQTAQRLLDPRVEGLPMELGRRFGRLEHRSEGLSTFDESDFLVVATVEDIFLPALAVIGSADAPKGEDSNPNVTLELDTGRTHVARGECIEVIPVRALLDQQERTRPG